METPLPEAVASGAQALFDERSWAIIALYMVATTILGRLLSHRQKTIRDFYLGGRRLPWPAVTGSIIATELSAMTLVGVPALLWADEGNMTYASLAFGTILARILVGWFILPRYYEKEFYSPYQYIGDRLGPRANRLTSTLFMIGGILGQGTRVLLTAIVLEVVTGLNIYASIWIVGAAAVVWTAMGGIVTVIWTDVIQFFVFTLSALATLVIILIQYESPTGEGGVAVIWRLAGEAGKLQWFDGTWDLSRNYTIWAAIIGYTISGLFAYGTDQMLVQRCLCCRDRQSARKAIIWSGLSQLLMLLCLFVGVGLWAYYRKNGLPDVPWPEEAAQFERGSDRVLPVFIKYRVPWFLGGLMVAGIFAAAISSLDSILAALSQQTLALLRPPTGGEDSSDEDDRKNIAWSRMVILIWAVVLCGMASLFHATMRPGGLLIELALAVVNFTSGAILGTLLMAMIPWLRRDPRGMEWGAAFSVLSVFAVTRHELWALGVLWIAVSVILYYGLHSPLNRRKWIVPRMIPFIVLLVFLNRYQGPYGGAEPGFIVLGWPWFATLGCSVMLAASLTLCVPPTKEWVEARGKL